MNTVANVDRSYVRRSHERCKILGINKEMVYSKKMIYGQEFQKKLEDNEMLILTVMPFMNELYNFVKGSNFFAILTDNEGCILNMIGDEGILTEAHSFRMIPGAYMNEENAGTNAMGTALAEGMPVQISAKEHYLKSFHRWTCSGSPIRNSKGDIIGVLDLTGYCQLVHPHTLGMVVAATSAISKMIQVNEYAQEANIARLHTETVLNSLDTGILTADLEGNITTLNKYVADMFGYSEAEMRNSKIYNLIDGWYGVKDKLLSGKTFSYEDVYINAKKNKLQYNLDAYCVYDKQKNVKEIVCVLKDIKRVRKLAGKIMSGQAIYSFDKIIGKNESFAKLIEYAKKVSDSRSTVLIMGESGTGKEVFAQSIHNYGDRKDEPFIAVNCGAIPRNLIESELFGYEEGAFTGARKGGYAGKFEIANGGTIFLDEIGEMPLDMQTKLLRVIEEGVIIRIGSTKQIPVDVRIIAATNKDLGIETEAGNFRKDLFYRLNVLPIYLPALRYRKDDIPFLINYFMKTISKRLNKRPIIVPDEYMDYLMNYDWPGNIRELENVVELIINTESLPTNFETKSPVIDIQETTINDECLKLEFVEKLHIVKVLKEFRGNITLASKALGIGRNTLYRKLDQFNIN
jgi:sigma-54 dependent transcriptional regulator, acetoin dehydrogenase operon transcriptional activator AcoR